VNYINEHGGVNHKQLTLGTAQDSQGTPAGAQAAFRAAIASNPFTMIGFSISSSMVGVESLLGQSNIPQFSTSGVPNTYFQHPWFYEFSTPYSVFNSSMLMTGTKNALGGDLQGAKVGLVNDGQSAAYAQIASTVKGLASKSGVAISPVITTQNAVPSFDAQAAQIVSANPAVTIVLISGDASHTTVVKALLNAGYKAKIVLDDPGSSDPLMKGYASSKVLGLRAVTIADPGTPLGQAARAAGVQSRYLSNEFFTLGVATIFGLQAALEKCGSNCSSASQLLSAAANLGEVTLPLGVYPGPVNFSRHAVLEYARAWTWDPQASAPTPVGAAFNVYGS
jgi:ABC-type branched-subunit amino acid transport system substrate-binding protein